MITIKEVYEAWAEGAEFRRKRHRYLNFCYGRQWNDPVEFGARMVTEEEAALQTGKRPMTNNLIRQMVKNIVGRFRYRLSQGEATSSIDAATARQNMIDELDSRALEEFLISGCAVQRIVRERRPGGSGVWVDNVDPDRLICNRYTDPRGNDLELVGMLHDMSLREVCARFGHGDAGRTMAIARLYEGLAETGSYVSLGSGESESFGRPRRGRCRVIECWTLETASRINLRESDTGRRFSAARSERSRIDEMDARRRQRGLPPLERREVTELEWHCHWLAPSGEEIESYKSPWSHGEHPFCLKHYPMTDGEVHSTVEDVIDTQKYINRLITLIDQVIGSAAKGVLLFPIGQKPDNYTWDDIAERWACPNGLIPYYPDGMSDGPRQIVANSHQTGAYSLLETEMRLMEQISGVNSAMAGRTDGSGMSAALFDAQTLNGTIGLMDTLACFDAFRELRDKKVKSIQMI
ncbi:MAG: hypothetical protein K2J18_07010 [Paramuribaculum sp.]|nr:hypothetical protein [Paramuribaculum sp.]